MLTAASSPQGRSGTPWYAALPSRWIAWGALVLCIAFTGASIALDVAYSRAMGDASISYNLVFPLAFLIFPAVGALIASRRPEHRIGWLFCVVGLWWSVLNFLAGSYASYALVARPGELPGGVLAGWITMWSWLPAIGLTIVVLPLLFPDGRLPGPRWRWVLYVAGLGMALGVLWAGFLPGTLGDDAQFHGYDNPLGIEALQRPLEAFGILGPLLVLGCGVAAAAGMIVRFRRSRGIERQQLKWCTFAMAVAAAGFLADVVMRLTIADQESIVSLLAGLCFCSIPIAAGIAILRYRLYDIDRIINRAVVYGALTVSLGLGYAGLVLLQQVITPAALSSDLWVAGSTLAAAALFRPLRARIQVAVDRRFYRSKYDAARTIDAFSSRLRDELDLDALMDELLAVVHETMQPAGASIWLRS